MRAHVAAVMGLARLIIAGDALVHQVNEAPGIVALEQRIPGTAPDHFDDVPARAAKLALEFLNDLAVAAHGAVEALQIAVDDEDEVVEFLARRNGNRAERFRFVDFSVAEEAPHLTPRGVRDAAVVQVLEKSRPRPIETVANCQKSGISHECGYEDSPRPPTS